VPAGAGKPAGRRAATAGDSSRRERLAAAPGVGESPCSLAGTSRSGRFPLGGRGSLMLYTCRWRNPGSERATPRRSDHDRRTHHGPGQGADWLEPGETCDRPRAADLLEPEGLRQLRAHLGQVDGAEAAWQLLVRHPPRALRRRRRPPGPVPALPPAGRTLHTGQAPVARRGGGLPQTALGVRGLQHTLRETAGRRGSRAGSSAAVAARARVLAWGGRSGCRMKAKPDENSGRQDPAAIRHARFSASITVIPSVGAGPAAPRAAERTMRTAVRRIAAAAWVPVAVSRRACSRFGRPGY
jgi:hypothetical protein